MTIAALRALQDEEQPSVVRQPAPWIPHATDRKETAVPATNSALVQADAAVHWTVGKLLAWADAHASKSIRTHSSKARTHIDALRAQLQADNEAAALDGEMAKLEKRLAELKAQKAELQPTKSRQPRSYHAATVRAWARENGIPVPDIGRVPKPVVDAWHQRNGETA